jgi:hypothetical protein
MISNEFVRFLFVVMNFLALVSSHGYRLTTNRIHMARQEKEAANRADGGDTDVGIIFDFRKMTLVDMYRLDIHLHKLIDRKAIAKAKINSLSKSDKNTNDMNMSQLDLIYRRPKA